MCIRDRSLTGLNSPPMASDCPCGIWGCSGEDCCRAGVGVGVGDGVDEDDEITNVSEETLSLEVVLLFESVDRT